jgi:hypothetical protein
VKHHTVQGTKVLLQCTVGAPSILSILISESSAVLGEGITYQSFPINRCSLERTQTVKMNAGTF